MRNLSLLVLGLAVVCAGCSRGTNSNVTQDQSEAQYDKIQKATDKLTGAKPAQDGQSEN